MAKILSAERTNFRLVQQSESFFVNYIIIKIYVNTRIKLIFMPNKIFFNIMKGLKMTFSKNNKKYCKCFFKIWKIWGFNIKFLFFALFQIVDISRIFTCINKAVLQTNLHNLVSFWLRFRLIESRKKRWKWILLGITESFCFWTVQ